MCDRTPKTPGSDLLLARFKRWSRFVVEGGQWMEINYATSLHPSHPTASRRCQQSKLGGRGPTKLSDSVQSGVSRVLHLGLAVESIYPPRPRPRSLCKASSAYSLESLLQVPLPCCSACSVFYRCSVIAFASALACVSLPRAQGV